MKKIYQLSFVLLAAVALAGCGAQKQKQPAVPADNGQENKEITATTTEPKKDKISATFKCKDDKKIIASFYGDYVDLELSDGRKNKLERAISASGARYATKDESFVFWNKGNTAFILENDKTTFSDCVEEQAK